MKIYGPKDARNEPRNGYTLGILAEVPLPKEVSSVGFFRPNIPPQGKLRNHYHEGLMEFMVFAHHSQIRMGDEIYTIFPGEIVLIFPGEPHEIIAGAEGSSPLIIKLPNNPEDIKFLEEGCSVDE